MRRSKLMQKNHDFRLWRAICLQVTWPDHMTHSWLQRVNIFPRLQVHRALRKTEENFIVLGNHWIFAAVVSSLTILRLCFGRQGLRCCPASWRQAPPSFLPQTVLWRVQDPLVVLLFLLPALILSQQVQVCPLHPVQSFNKFPGQMMLFFLGVKNDIWDDIDIFALRHASGDVCRCIIRGFKIHFWLC